MTAPISPYVFENEDLNRMKGEAQAGLESLRAGLLISRPFLAMVAMRLDLVAVVDDRLKTAATNGSTIFFDARFFAACSPEKRLFVFAHEVWHCALGHMSRRGSRLSNLWNLATDHEINELLDKDGFPMPEDAVYFPQLWHLNAEQVYEALLENQEDRPHDFDVHLPRPDLHVSLEQCHRSVLIDPDFTPLSAAPSAARSKQLRQSAARDTLRRHGKLPGIIQLELDKIKQSSLDWRPILAQFLQQAIPSRLVWTRPLRRHVHAGLYLPSRQRDRIRIAIAVDVSGSAIGLLSRFLSEVAYLLAQPSVAGIDLMANFAS